MADRCRKHSFIDTTGYKLKAKFGGIDVCEAKRPKGMEHLNTGPKPLLADPMLDSFAFKDTLGKNCSACREENSGCSSCEGFEISGRRTGMTVGYTP